MALPLHFSRGDCSNCGGVLHWVEDSWICWRCRDEWPDETLRAAKSLAVGHRIYRWWDTGAFGMDMQPLTVIRANRKTVTVQTDQGSIFRLPYEHVAGYYDEDD